MRRVDDAVRDDAVRDDAVRDVRGRRGDAADGESLPD